MFLQTKEMLFNVTAYECVVFPASKCVVFPASKCVIFQKNSSKCK
jgi:hypothetical protein